MVGKPLQDKSWAVLFLNNNDYATNMTCSATCFESMGFDASSVLSVRDIWAHDDVGRVTAQQGFTHMVPANGSSAFLRFTMYHP